MAYGASLVINRGLEEEFRSFLGPEGISTDKMDLVTYGYDATRKSYSPCAVVWPVETAQVARIFRIASREGIPVYPRGSGSGMTGGALPVSGGIVLALERMIRILEIDTANRTVTAQPGIFLGDLKKAVQEKGLFYPPDPSSAKVASLGGTLAESSGGLNCVKYGTTKDYVLAVEAVLPDGEIIRLGSKSRKSVSGYNLLQLLIGSEGTLAVITEATLRLVPFPEHRCTFLSRFGSIKDAGKAVLDILNGPVVPSALEFMDRMSLECVDAYMGREQIAPCEAVLLVEADGFDPDTVLRDAQTMEEICRRSGAETVQRATEPEDRESLWEIRRNLSPSMYQKAPFKFNEDISVPVAEFPAVLQEVYQIGAKHGVPVICFGHAGDGNIHVNFMCHTENDPAAHRGIEETFGLAIAHGGTLSGEHGIGITKSEFLPLEWGEREIELMRNVKRLFDPQNILNPGKIFPEKKQGTT
ncbi:MAG TPA: FAD-linked oxidase C-terminal domain-containing protein [bacterium]|nr:FAD-linked oxidase C-terminal domain-containing protein [bacterium]HQL63902.1 FAD-linked oxidase C-terminal domain-containing protein [bacterium]